MQGSRQPGHTLVTLHGLVGAFLEPLWSLGRCSRGNRQGLQWAGTTWGTASEGNVGVFLWGRGASAGGLWLQGWSCHGRLQLLQALIHL